MSRLLPKVLCVIAILLTPAAVWADEPARHAVLVGVRTYEKEGWDDLKYPENDVEALGDILRAAGFKVTVLTVAEGKKNPARTPTRANIDKSITAALTGRKKGDVILVALAGHGKHSPNTKDSYFCPHDAVFEARETDTGLASLISLSELYKQLGDCGAGAKLLLVDACRNDPDPARGRGPGATGTSAPRPPKGVAALYSCSENERAWEVDGYRHGVFFYHVIEGLRGKAKNTDGDVTWDDLVGYVRRQVPRDLTKIKPGEKQTPSLNAGELAGEPPVLVGSNVSLNASPALAIVLRSLSPAAAEAAGLAVGVQPQIDFVIPGGGGDRMGLQAGDLLLKVNGRAVESVYEFKLTLAELATGEKVELLVLRRGKKLALEGRYQTFLSPVEKFRRVREASADDSAAENLLAEMYKSGDGVKEDTREAAACYKRAAELGHPGAQLAYGLIRIRGADGNPPAREEGFRWVRKAADRGDPEAATVLSQLYKEGIGTEKDSKAADEWLRKTADRGYPDAMASLGHDIAFSIPTKKGDDGSVSLNLEKYNPVLAEGISMLKKAAAKGSASAMRSLSILHSSVWSAFWAGTNSKESIEWLKKSAVAGLAQSQIEYGKLNETGEAGFGDKLEGGPNPKEAFAWYMKAAEQNSIQGIANLARCHARGIGTERNPEFALTLYKLLADNNAAEGLYGLGQCHEEGIGVKKNLDEAIRLYKEAAAKDHEGAKKKLKDLKKD